MKKSSSQSKPLVECWKFPMPAAMLCEIPIKSSGEPPPPPGSIWKCKTKIRLCCWCRKHKTKARRSKTQISSRSRHCQRDAFYNSSQYCAQIHSDASSILKKSTCNGDSGEIMRNTWENTGMAADKSQKQERGDRWSKWWGGQKSSFLVIDGSLSPQEFGVGTNISKIQRPSCTPRWHDTAYDSGLYAVFSEQGSSASQMKAAKVTLLKDYRDAQNEQQMQYPLIPRSNWRMHRRYRKFPKSECPDIWIRLPKHKWPKSWSSVEEPVFLLSEICMVILWQDYYVTGNSRKFYWKTVGKVPNCDCLFVHRQKTFLVCVRGRYKTDWKEAEH